jgi:hypothetical protein
MATHIATRAATGNRRRRRLLQSHLLQPAYHQEEPAVVAPVQEIGPCKRIVSTHLVWSI